MKQYQRRALGKLDYWKVATWNNILFCWKAGICQFNAREEAVASVQGKRGKYRLSFFKDGESYQDMEEFVIC